MTHYILGSTYSPSKPTCRVSVRVCQEKGKPSKSLPVITKEIPGKFAFHWLRENRDSEIYSEIKDYLVSKKKFTPEQVDTLIMTGHVEV